MAAICAIADTIPPAFIHQGDFGDLRDSWIDDPEAETVHFAATPTSWTCNSVGQQWLETAFDCYTKAKAGQGYRLLLVDGHYSHVNLSFLTMPTNIESLFWFCLLTRHIAYNPWMLVFFHP